MLRAIASPMGRDPRRVRDKLVFLSYPSTQQKTIGGQVVASFYGIAGCRDGTRFL